MASNDVEEATEAMTNASLQDPSVTQRTNRKEKEPKAEKYTLDVKTPKGTRDYGPWEMNIRLKVFETIQRIFRLRGAVTIDTPVFELRHILTSKYGEDSKLIYDLADQGGELCSLRYDLTVPFARYLAENKIQQMKRYHIAKVYRRDQPIMTKGRYREFYQCDYDIAGTFELMVPDAEVICTMCDILTELQIGEYVIKLNHRQLLDGIFEVCGVPEDKFRSISSAVDKLDKLPWSEVRREMVAEKGLEESAADEIGVFVQMSGGRALIQALKERTQDIATNVNATKALDELNVLFDYLEVYGVADKISFDLSLARGLDYYTGVIYEAVLIGAQVGSIAAGGRYDRLVGQFAPRSPPIPCVGMSIGVERIFSILEAKAAAQLAPGQRRPVSGGVSVLVTSIGNSDKLLTERMRFCRLLWQADIRAEMSLKRKVKILDQFMYCERENIPLCVLFGDDEMTQGVVKIKMIQTKEEVVVRPDELVAELRRRLV